jgi:hypothetical protein
MWPPAFKLQYYNIPNSLRQGILTREVDFNGAVFLGHWDAVRGIRQVWFPTSAAASAGALPNGSKGLVSRFPSGLAHGCR